MVVSMIVIGLWAPLVFFVLYNLVHVSMRLRLYWVGLTRGDRLVEQVAKANLPARGARLREVAAVSAGALAAWRALQFGALVGGQGAPLLAAGCLVVGGLGYWLDSKFGTTPWLMLVGGLFGCIAGFYVLLKAIRGIR